MINSKNVTTGGLAVKVLRSAEDAAAEDTFIFKVERAQAENGDNGGSWRYKELTDVTVTVESGATDEARFDANLNNKNWLFGNCSGSLEPSPAAQQNSSSQQALPNDNKVPKPYRDFLEKFKPDCVPQIAPGFMMENYVAKCKAEGRCTFCLTKRLPGAKFCTECGKKFVD